MRICIVGAGAIGGLLGVRLANSGHDVSVFARGDNLDAIRSKGMRLVEPDGSELIVTDLRAAASTRELSTQEIVVLALKAHQIGGIADQLPSLYASDTIVMTVQNGLPWWFFQGFGGEYEGRRIGALDPDGTIHRFIPGDRIVGSIAYPAAERIAPAVIRLIEGDRFPVGELDGTRIKTRRTTITSAHRCRFQGAGADRHPPAPVDQSMGQSGHEPDQRADWRHAGRDLQVSPTRNLAAQMMHEAAEVAERLGLPLRLSVEQRLDGAEKVGAHKTSMLQDVEAGRALEIEPLIGSFLELGELTRTPMPATKTIYSLVSLLNARLTHTPDPG